jgi:hypothetical protein
MGFGLEFRLPAGTRNFSPINNINTGSGMQLAYYLRGTGNYFHGDKAAEV